MDYYAHSLEGQPPEKWQRLEEHLKNVAKMAEEFAAPFGGEAWARIAGLWHDLGKYSNAFQKRLFDANGVETHIETVPGRVIHSQAGGHLATLRGWRGIDRLVAWLIMGHHSGLTDFSPDRMGAKSLEPKMREPEASMSIFANVPLGILNQDVPYPHPAGVD
ncbi:MAG: CRISPR-associated endonuclease Cas3'' [Verrucomicrobia bacterium]|jgi:CRISPR-associated endonuclease/helicase Cas3|nr:CRISPR-associated endonuclease Cas3'' [Verrucomicrobiota bacterium]